MMFYPHGYLVPERGKFMREENPISIAYTHAYIHTHIFTYLYRHLGLHTYLLTYIVSFTRTQFVHVCTHKFYIGCFIYCTLFVN